MKTASFLILGMASPVAAFISTPASTVAPSVTHLHATVDGEQSRRGFVQNLGLAGVMTAAFVASPIPAFADEGESPAVMIPLSSNLRNIKRAEKQLSKLELYAVDNEYENLKLALRNAPFSEVRKNSFALIKEYADQPDQQSIMQASYNVFIKAVEQLDGTASLGMRGRKMDNGALLQTFQATSTALNDWIAVATAAASS